MKRIVEVELEIAKVLKRNKSFLNQKSKAEIQSILDQPRSGEESVRNYLLEQVEDDLIQFDPHGPIDLSERVKQLDGNAPYYLIEHITMDSTGFDYCDKAIDYFENYYNHVSTAHNRFPDFVEKAEELLRNTPEDTPEGVIIFRQLIKILLRESKSMKKELSAALSCLQGKKSYEVVVCIDKGKLQLFNVKY